VIDLRAVERANDVRRFQGLCQIVREDGSTGLMETTPIQAVHLDAVAEHSWTFTVKHRQAKITTATIMDCLRHVMYHPGQRGLVVAEKRSTAKEAFRRLAHAYRHLPPPIQIPTLREPSGEAIEFKHGGLVSIITGGGEAPAIGHSPDYAHITEFGEFEDQDNFIGHFFPSINKRPHAKVRIETTPGEFNSPAHLMWKKALADAASNSGSRFRPVFLCWWDDASCVLRDSTGQPVDPRDFLPTQEELALAEKMPGITPQHFLWRRERLDTEFHGDTRLFDHKYPPGPYDGWITHGSPAIPLDAVRRMREASAVSVPDGEERFFEEREPGAPYLITADPAGFGETGDPSAATLWHGWDRREVGSWSGRTDPGRFADIIMRWQKDWNADVVVETNKGECCATLVSRGCEKLFWDGAQPGWYSTDVKKASALADLVDDLRKGDVTIRTLQTLDQLESWDGKTRKRTGGHHFDRAVTCMIAAYAFRTLGYGTRARVVAPRDPNAPLRVSEFLATFKERKRGNVCGL
jgi:hypothetical protein